MRQRNYILILILLIIILFTRAGYSAELLGKRIVLDNGMILLLSEKHDIPMVTMSMAIKAGSLVEPADKPGLASLTASLLTQGTAKRTASQISREIDFIGGSLSVSGGSDFASAGLRVLTKDLRTGLDLLSDVLLNPVFDQKEIDRKVKESLAGSAAEEEPGIIAGRPLLR
jgi:zinc protease